MEDGRMKKFIKFIFSVFLMLVCGWLFTSLIKGSFIDKYIRNYSANRIVQKVISYGNGETEWIRFNSISSKFEMLFPYYPHHQVEQFKIKDLKQELKMDSYSSIDSNGMEYAMNSAEYPAEVDLSSPKNNLEGSINGMLQAIPNGKLVYSEFVEFKKKYIGVEYLLQSNKNIIKGVIYLVDRRMYQLAVLYKNNNYKEKNYQKFITSFELKI